MPGKWIQLWVKLKDGIEANPIFLMKRCDPILQRFGAVPCAPEGTPIRSADGTIEVRVYSGELGLGMVKGYLSDQGFEVVREQTND